MFTRKSAFSSAGRVAAMATVAAIALTAIEPSMASAASPAKGVHASAARSGATDISSRRRVYHGGGGAAAAAAFAGIVGTGIAIAASRDAYDYDGGPAYYGGGPAYYDAGPAYYGNGYYGGYGGGYRSGVPYVNGHPLAGW